MLDVAVAFPFVFKTSAAYEELVELLVSDETESSKEIKIYEVVVISVSILMYFFLFCFS